MSSDRPSVLVTGGAHRLGKAIVQRFAAAGWHVVIHYGRSRHAAEALAETLAHAETVGCDLADGDAAVAMIASLTGRIPDWRAFINCAAIFEFDNVTELDPATNERAMQVNARTPARMAQAYLAGAQARLGRRVIHVTDQKIANPNPDFFSYTMSKHALAATVPMLAMGACRPEDRVYALAPGAILASHDQREEETELSHRMNLLARKTAKEEVADAALFLAEGSLKSGQTLYLDSGQHLLRQPRDVIYLAREGAAS
ncbi:SDR family oxidoreductase [Qipengyuania sp. RANM35]|uniref:SDR family oxidoreductase n=1 Tax=Qipengyuania sp. RANM35 TaxID=3068635 RepID=UPI0034DB640C